MIKYVKDGGRMAHRHYWINEHTSTVPFVKKKVQRFSYSNLITHNM